MCRRQRRQSAATAARFALIIDSLLQAVAEQGGKRIAGPLTKLIWNRLRRMAVRFAAIRRCGPRLAGYRPEIASSDKPRVRGPNPPIEPITITIARAINSATARVPPVRTR